MDKMKVDFNLAQIEATFGLDGVSLYQNLVYLQAFTLIFFIVVERKYVNLLNKTKI